LVLADLRGATLVGRRLATPSARYGIALEQMLRLPISGPVVTAGRPRRLLLSSGEPFGAQLPDPFRACPGTGFPPAAGSLDPALARTRSDRRCFASLNCGVA